MPIKPENRARYPADWPQIRKRILRRAGWRCECDGCAARQYAVGKWVRLTVGAWHFIEWHPPSDAYAGAMDAERLGLAERVTNIERRRGERTTWQPTPLGRDFLAGRVHQVETRPGGRRWAATWLRSLPQGLRIEKPASRAPDLARHSESEP